MSRLWRDTDGSSLVEFTLVFPVVIAVAFGTVDVAYLLYEWNQASKATYLGVRRAVVSDPLAPSVSDPVYNAAFIGQSCFDTATGASTGLCPTVNYTCGALAGTCPGYDASKLTPLVTAMQTVFPRVAAANVQVRYQTTGLGFVGRPGGLPMTVTVSIQCMRHRMFFLNVLSNWISPAAPQGCPAGGVGVLMPSFESTLPSEDVDTN